MDMKFYRRASDNTKGLLTILLLSSVTGLCLYYNSLTPLTEEEDPCLWPDSVSAVSVKIHSRRSIELLETKQNENTKINFESSKIPSSEMQQKSTLTCNLKDFSKKSCDEMVCSNKIIPKLQTNPDLYLPESATKEINTFVLFLGHPRSGTTITGYLLDAHPHILLSTEYHVLSQIEENWEFHSNKINLYSALAFRQKQASKNVAERQEKKVSVFLNGSWNANYDRYIQVIGDKKASRTVETWLSNPDKSKATIEKLKKIVGISIKYIQVVRNPFDNIATLALYLVGGYDLRHNLTQAMNGQFAQQLSRAIDRSACHFFARVEAIEQMTEALSLDIHQIHLPDLVKDPVREMQRMCDFLSVECSQQYLDICMRSTAKQLSKTRSYIHWNKEQVNFIEESIKKYPYLRRYSFDSEI